MSPWKSRWSWERLVNAPTAKAVPPTRSSASAWLETSIGRCVTPRSTIAASRACISGASGVVNELGSRSAPIRLSTVPSSPVEAPAIRSPASSRYVVVVLPDVPVTPSTASRVDGSPWIRAESGPSAARGSGCTTTGTCAPARAGRAAPTPSVSTAAAPAVSASAAKSAPCGRPGRTLGRAANRSPGCTCEARSATPVTTALGHSDDPDHPGGTAAPASAASSSTGTGTVRCGRSGVPLGVTEVVEGVTGKVTVRGVGGGWVRVAPASVHCCPGSRARDAEGYRCGQRTDRDGSPVRRHSRCARSGQLEQLREHILTPAVATPHGRGLIGQLGRDDQGALAGAVAHGQRLVLSGNRDAVGPDRTDTDGHHDLDLTVGIADHVVVPPLAGVNRASNGVAG